MSSSLVSRAWRAVRAADWWAYKIPPLLVILYAGLLEFAEPGFSLRVAMGALSILFVATFGYILNDIWDVEADRASGRPNRAASIGSRGRTALIILPLVGALAASFWSRDPVIGGLVFLNVLLPTLYSVEPIRLKGRGAWGALADATGVHLIPAAIVAWSVVAPATSDLWSRVAFSMSALLWSFTYGLRGILIHQVRDRHLDELAGVKTLGAELGARRSRHIVLFFLFPLELICLAVFLALLLPRAWAAAAALAVFFVLEATRVRRGWIQPLFDPPGESRERYVPVVGNELYEIWLPSALAIDLALESPAAWVVVALQALVFFPNLRARLSDIKRLLASREEPKPARIEKDDYQVIVGTTSWTVNGVNVFSANLARGFSERGIRAHVLLTEEETDRVQVHERRMPRSQGVDFESLPLERTDSWGRHWGAMVRYLEEAAPCVYIPNSDWRHSCVCPRLSSGVVVIGVVHSDDPLHYAHVRRLGEYWNAIVCVSEAVAKRTAEECPALADRITTIPIGVRMPDARPARTPSRALRLIYHGVLKQHQKRILDLPRVVRASLDLGVPVELSIVGSGPDEDALREAAKPMVDSGAIRFLGLVSPDDTPEILAHHDAYLLTSEFEGMPNALIEAMARGCVPVVTQMKSGIPELVLDGDNGFLVPIGDMVAFARRLQRLWEDPALRERMSARAFETVVKSRFRVEAMVDAYRNVFDRAWADVRSGRFKRSIGPLSHPPPQVAGVNLFPVDLPQVENNIGAFPSYDDADDYAGEIQATVPRSGIERTRLHNRIRLGASRESLLGVRVIVAVPLWIRNGVSHWAEDLVRGLSGAGIDARILLTEEGTDLVRVPTPRLSRPSDIRMEELGVSGEDNWGARWGAMVRVLEEPSVCVYFPTYDWRHSCVTPLLDSRVVTVGTLHSADADYHEHAARLGEFWNAAVALNGRVAGQIRRKESGLQNRLWSIPHGHAVPKDRVPKSPVVGRPLTVLLPGDPEHSREAEWLLGMWRAFRRQGDRFRVVIAEPSSSLGALAEAAVDCRVNLNRLEWLDLCRSADFAIAQDPGGEARRMMIEAMGHGCIPVWSRREKHVPTTVPSYYDEGVVVRTEHPAEIVDAILGLSIDQGHCDRLRERAHHMAGTAGFRTDQMIAAYLDLFRWLIATRDAGAFRRSPGGVTPPPPQIDGVDIFPVPLRERAPEGPFPSQRDIERFRQEVHQNEERKRA